jgi:hypothetical protein
VSFLENERNDQLLFVPFVCVAQKVFLHKVIVIDCSTILYIPQLPDKTAMYAFHREPCENTGERVVKQKARVQNRSHALSHTPSTEKKRKIKKKPQKQKNVAEIRS